ncbi:MAG: 3-hydroxybutyryl-CoA dehydrogenase [Bacteroidota bacterium]|nr:3-hydroxybutyryl-CoA dehydrogenase [Bacteroidota bacterium]MDW8137493.1 3-hydroxybutyryl-CoA dehydrogenase [Bacteroidota bacterium]
MRLPKSIAVVGAGTMGNGIAHVFALHGFSVRLFDVAPEAIARALRTIERNLDRQIQKGLIPKGDKEAALGRIQAHADLEAALTEVELVVEAAPEQVELKLELFARFDALAPPEAILASNTSSISITRLASATRRPDRVIGMHFFNPVPVMELVEIISGLQTSEETFRVIEETARRLGKTPVAVRDFPGFVSNRVLMPMINEAIWCLYEGVATAEAIDQVMRLGMRHPMGPLRLADLIGLDVCLHILNVLYEGFKDPKYRPCPLLVKMVEAGQLGEKTGRGFYEYKQAEP